jgi:hypothetical protein
MDLFNKVKIFHKGNAPAFAAGVAWVYCSMNRTELQEEGIKFPTLMFYGIGESGKNIIVSYPLPSRAFK